jgi:FAD/FMN-containing dehydrogenase
MTAQALLLCYAAWERDEHDAANAAWHSQAIAALDEFSVGHYVGESDIVRGALRAERSYAPANWKRLRSLRDKYDPGGLFLGHFQ